ncbi:hypothetical protein GA0115233_107642 [Streptomyces sp. DI166]|uniref:hypothetical protein n=1 Tax=Streptomyces sp. DI166 TaxID=1839783 RepID=UPI0007F492A1|nr:hypothetical protein [Streptomyces sp. DI166]SBT94008.1 hypothetical protein GA0115233_107642 [Streptomyces sp. DI166]
MGSMPTYRSELEKKLALLDRQAKVFNHHRETVTATAVDLVLHHREPLGPTATRAGLTAHALRQALHEHPEVAPIVYPERYVDGMAGEAGFAVSTAGESGRGRRRVRREAGGEELA